MKLTTTLNKIRACHPCASGWKTLIKHVGENFNPDAEINLLTILDSNGVADMLWCLRATEQDARRIASQLAIEFAEQALPIFEKRRPDDTRPRAAIQAARDFVEDKIDRATLLAARNAAADAAAADAADAAAYAAAYAYAAYAAAAAADAADAAAADAAAAYAAAYAYAAYAAAAVAAAADAAAYATREKARARQAEIIRSILEP